MKIIMESVIVIATLAVALTTEELTPQHLAIVNISALALVSTLCFYMLFEFGAQIFEKAWELARK